jgi:hypothetical protein
VRRRQPVPSIARRGVRIGDSQEPADGLLLKPFADVALDGPGDNRQLARRGGALGVERAVEAEPVSDVDGGNLKRRDRGVEDALDQRLGGRGIDGRANAGRRYARRPRRS